MRIGYYYGNEVPLVACLSHTVACSVPNNTLHTSPHLVRHLSRLMTCLGSNIRKQAARGGSEGRDILQSQGAQKPAFPDLSPQIFRDE